MRKKIAFVFDVDDTIYNQILPFRDACRDVLTVEVPEQPEAWYQMFLKCSQEMFRANENGEISLEESRVQRAVNTMKRCKIPFSREQAVTFQERYLYHQLTLQISDTMRGILTECISKGSALGILTNGPYEHQMSKIRAMHLPELIPEDHILVSEKAGYTKPDVRIFRMMEEMLDMEPQQIYMIGDSYANDIAGAVDAGWHSIWMNHHHRSLPDGGKQPEFVVQSEEELAELVGNLMIRSCEGTEQLP